MEAIELSYLKRMIGAASFQFDSLLEKKGYNPEKLRKQFYDYVSNSSKFTFFAESEFDETGRVCNNRTNEFQIKIKSLARETILAKVKIADCIIIEFDKKKDEECYSDWDTYYGKKLYLVIYQNQLKTINCFLIEVPYMEPMLDDIYYSDEPNISKQKINLFQAIQKYGTLATYIGERFGFDILLKSLAEK